MIEQEIEVNKLISKLGEFPILKYHLKFSAHGMYNIAREVLISNISKIIFNYEAVCIALNITPTKISLFDRDETLFIDVTVQTTKIIIDHIEDDIYSMLKEKLVNTDVTIGESLIFHKDRIEVRS